MKGKDKSHESKNNRVLNVVNKQHLQAGTRKQKNSGATLATGEKMEVRVPTRKDKTSSYDNERVKIFRALADRKFKFRTIRGISKDAGVPADRVLKVIGDASDKVVISSRKSKNGEPLYTSRERYEESASIAEKFLGVIFNRVY